MVCVVIEMADDGFWKGLAAGGFIAGPLIALGVWCFSEGSYRKGLTGEELASIGLFGLLGQTRDGTLVLVPSFERGQYHRELMIRVQDLEWKVYRLEQAYGELKVGYTVLKSQYVTLKNSIETLEEEVQDIREVVSRIPELRAKMDKLLTRLQTIKNSKKMPPYYG